MRELNRIVSKKRRLPARMRMKKVNESQHEFKERTPRGLRKKIKKRRIFSTSEKIDIVHRALVKMEKLKDIGSDYNRKVASMSILVSKARKNPKFIEELLAEKACLIDKKKELDNFISTSL